jgi:hypothetical protein
MKIKKTVDKHLSEIKHMTGKYDFDLEVGDTIEGLTDNQVIVLNKKTLMKQGGSGSHYELVGEHLGKQFKVVLTGKELDAICKG